MKKMGGLKPCPFCGGTPYMAQNYLGQKYVRCHECGACVWGRDTDDWSVGKMGEKQAEKAAAEIETRVKKLAAALKKADKDAAKIAASAAPAAAAD